MRRCEARYEQKQLFKSLVRRGRAIRRIKHGLTSIKYQPAPRLETKGSQRAKDSQNGDESVQLCGAQIRFPRAGKVTKVKHQTNHMKYIKGRLQALSQFSQNGPHN